MRITPLQTFLDGRDRYEAGDSRTVSDADGERFIKNGWAVESGTPAPEAPAAGVPPVALEVQNLVHPQGVSHG